MRNHTLRRLALVLPLLAAASGCKRQLPSVELQGYTGDAVTRTIDYAGIYGEGGRTVTFTNVIAYESTYRRPTGGPGGDDEGAIGALRTVQWLESEANEKLFNGRLEVRRDRTTLPNRADMIQLGRTYTWEALARGVSVRYDGRQVTTDVLVRIVLGPSILGPQLTMPSEFRAELARAMVEDDVVTYNGHIWSADADQATSPWQPAPIDANTRALADAIRNHRSVRTKPGLLYMNACRAEKIEAALMDALLRQPETAGRSAAGQMVTGADHYAQTAPAHGEYGQYALNDGMARAPILLSHRNYSNFDYFPDHIGTVLIDMIHGCSLPSLMLDLTTTAKGTSFQASNGAGYCEQDVDEAKRKLSAYLSQPGIKQNPKAVIVVAYDIINGKLKQESF